MPCGSKGSPGPARYTSKFMATVKKPSALKSGASVRVVLPASPARAELIERGVSELRRLGYSPGPPRVATKEDGYFAGTTDIRVDELFAALGDKKSGATIAARGGYGSTCLLDALAARKPFPPQIVMGFSDLTALFIYLWQKHRWVTFHGPMVAAGFDCGPGAAGGYDEDSFRRAVSANARAAGRSICRLKPSGRARRQGYCWADVSLCCKPRWARLGSWTREGRSSCSKIAACGPTRWTER